MKIQMASIVLMVCCVSCYKKREIDFVFFNVSNNEIVVDSITGLPLWIVPGVLIPVHAEDRLSESSISSFDGPISVPSVLKIDWHESSSLHYAELKTADLGIPDKIESGRVSFTYLGGDKWRVKVVP